MRSLTIRLLIFNILLVFFPVGGILVLDTYEKQLLNSMERSMVQQGRVLSAALTNRNTEEESLRILKNLQGRLDSRIRVVNGKGELLADSSDPRLYDTPPEIPGESKSYRSYIEDPPESLRDNWLYQAAVSPVNLLRRLFLPPSAPLGSAEYYSNAAVLMGPEIQAALTGRYGAFTRYSSGGQRSVNLYSALPIRQGAEVVGAVLVSRSTYNILLNLYSLRLDMIRIFLFSLIAAAVLSLLLARTITIPVKKLRKQAETFLDHRGRLTGEFKALKNKDEIGTLSQSLFTLSRKLEEYISFISGFSADVSHEIKNPVAAIRTAAELAEQSGTEEQKPLFLLIRRETGRIQRLLDDLRDLSRLDVSLETEERQILLLPDFLVSLQEEWNRRSGRTVLKLQVPEGGRRQGLSIRISADRFRQCLINLLDNADSLSAGGEEILLKLYTRESCAVIEIMDRGPGIPRGMENKIFDRFYSDREEDERKSHSGLGLSIVRSIVEGYGGSISASGRPGGGACFRLEFPAYRLSD